MTAASFLPAACRIVGTGRRRAASLLGLGMLIAWLAQPSTMFADAVGTGDPVTSPGPDLLGQLVGVVPTVGLLGASIAVLVALGYVVSRIGGPPVTADDLQASERSATREGLGTLLAGALLVAAAVAGFLAGRSSAYKSSIGGMDAIFAWVYLILIVGGSVVGLVLVGLVATGFRHGRLSWAIRTIFLAAGLVAAGALAGAATAGATGGTYRQPVVLRAPAQLHVTLDHPSIAFAARDDGRAECRSVGDSRMVSDVSGLDLGELGPGTLRVGFALGVDGPTTASVELFIDGGDLPEGSPMISWTGEAEVTTASADAMSGRLSFSALPISRGDGKPAPDSTSAPYEGPWPATLSGSLTWTCDPWSDAQSADRSTQPPVMTPVAETVSPFSTDPNATPAVPTGDAVEPTPFAPPQPLCPSPPGAIIVPVVVVSTDTGAGIVAQRGSSTFSTCTTTASEDRVLTDPIDAMVAHPGDSMILTLSAGWGFLRWEGADRPVVGDAANIWPPVDIAGGPARIEVPVPNRTGDSIVDYNLWLVGLNGHAVGQLEIRVLVRVP